MQSELHDKYLNPLRTLNRTTPYVTYALIGIIVAVWAIDTFLGNLLIELGAMSGIGIIQYGQLWRMFTAIFLHAGIAHLGFNGFALYSLGREAELLFGRGRYLAVFLLSGLVGNVLSLAVRGVAELSVGASGGVFGIIGMNLAYFIFHRDRLGEFGKKKRGSMIQLIGLNLILGFSIPRINNLAHIGGMVAGIVLGYVLAPRLKLDRATMTVTDIATLRHRWWLLVVTIAALAIATAAIILIPTNALF